MLTRFASDEDRKAIDAKIDIAAATLANRRSRSQRVIPGLPAPATSRVVIPTEAEMYANSMAAMQWVNEQG